MAAALEQLFALSPAERAAMAAASGRAHVAAHYSWPQEAEQTRQLYAWILGGWPLSTLRELTSCCQPVKTEFHR
jgi:glycosyltransferase involved in cell wall biosynthesis